eukprot:357392-Chlamydomonas_euryale.AAC.28
MLGGAGGKRAAFDDNEPALWRSHVRIAGKSGDDGSAVLSLPAKNVAGSSAHQLPQGCRSLEPTALPPSVDGVAPQGFSPAPCGPSHTPLHATRPSKATRTARASRHVRGSVSEVRPRKAVRPAAPPSRSAHSASAAPS